MQINYTLIKGDKESRARIGHMLYDIERMANKFGYVHMTLSVGELRLDIIPESKKTTPKPKQKGNKAVAKTLSTILG